MLAAIREAESAPAERATRNNSAIIDPYGNVVQRVITPGGARALLVADIAVGSANTLSVRLGDQTIIKNVFVTDLNPPSQIAEQRVQAAQQELALKQAQDQLKIDSAQALGISGVGSVTLAQL